MTLSISPDSAGAWLAPATFALSTALVWLGAGMAGAARVRPAPLTHVLGAAAALLMACGLWWPAHAMARELGIDIAGMPAVGSALAWIVALALAGLSRIAAEFIHRRKLAWLVGVVMGALALAYGQAMLVAPGIFRLGAQAGPGAAGAVMTAMVAALVATHAIHADERVVHGLRAGGALAAAGVMMLGAALSLPSASSSMGALELPMLAGVAALAAVLLVVLRSGEKTEPVRRAARRAATVDSLTQLPTRVYFETKLAASAKQCDGKGQRLALFFIDLDGFKPVNDTFGHSSGDRVLEQVGARLRAIVRGRDVAARVGGDEFLLLVHGATSNEAAAQVAQRLIERLSEPYTIDAREVMISCSVGIAVYPDGCDASKLIARADVAMYAAKRAGGSKHRFYAPEMDADAQANFDMVAELRQAIANNELELFYQPKIDARSGKVTAAEALVRWRHPTRGRLMPGEFIPVAERFGIIGALGNWVIEDACRQSRAWRDKGLRMRVAINLSVYQMRQDDIVDRIDQALKKHRIHPSLLTCEITESAAMEDTLATQETFRRLGELGTHLSIDDFGTGYSSLAYLRKLPAEELKIDRAFVMDLETSKDARVVVEAVVKLAHALELKVVAEGVENTRQQEILAELGCDEMQGYLFAKPMSARALLLWALGDKSESAAFRTSLFGETREAPRPAAVPVGAAGRV